MKTGTLADTVIDALVQRKDVLALTLFGSRARAGDNQADAQSDVDLQIVTSRPGDVARAEWLAEVIGSENLTAWNVRAAFGGVQKVSVLLRDAELDLVIIPAARMRLARWSVALGLHRRNPGLRRKLGDIALVMVDGFQVLKGGSSWDRFYRSVVREVPVPGLSDAEVRNLAAGVRVDLVSIERKLTRGELRAAQRWLHIGLAETVWKLSHEHRRRAGQRSFHDARRIEFLMTPDELIPLTISVPLEREALRKAARQMARTAADLAARLLAD